MNKPTGTIVIHGREYQTVAFRVQQFREAFPVASITTEILHRDDDVVIMRASIANEDGRVLSTGHAEEWRKSSAINKTSAIENAETSAIGRALAALGWGGTEFATANEIEIARNKEKALGGADLTKHTATQVAKDAMEALDSETATWVRECAMEVIARMEAQHTPASVIDYIESQKMDGDEKLALWSQLPSNVRSAIKKASKPVDAVEQA
jgi:hypothetical protein